jgi:hypothetical protein
MGASSGRDCNAALDVRGGVPAGSAVARRTVSGRPGPAAKDFLVELPGLGFGLHAQLPPERVDTALVLPERGVAPAVQSVQLHQRAMHDLLQRVEHQELLRGLDGRRRTRLHLMSKQSSQCLERQIAQPLPLDYQPFLERRAGEPHACQQISSIELRRLLKGFGIRPAGKPLEG